MSRRTVRNAGILLAVLLAAACGQKPSAREDAADTSRRASESQDRTEQLDESAELDVETTEGKEEALTEVPFDLGETPALPAPAVEEPRSADSPAPAAPAAPRSSARRARSAPAGPLATAPSGGDDSAPPVPERRPSPSRTEPPAPGPSSAPGSPPAEQSGKPVPETPPPPPPAPPRQAVEGPVDRTGVSKTSIRIGVHAPVTGAAPFPQSAFEKSKDLYWKFLQDEGGVWDRNVQVVFRDDEFNPTKAVQVCREMVEEEQVFALIGAAGADQITACARYAEAAGVPYFSAGVNEEGLSDLNLYFALSQTYSQQSDTLVSLIKNRLRQHNIAVVVASNAALNDALRNFTYTAERAGLKIVRSSRVSKTGSDAELLAEANQLKNSGADVVYVLMSPVNFIKLATNAQAQAFTPTWVGPGTTNGLQIVAQAGCPSIGAAKFLSPFPQLDAIDDLDPNYRRAYTKHISGEADDVGILQWGLAKTVHQVLEATGSDLSRQSFLATLTSGQTFKTNVYPDVRFDSRVRFGASTMHLLEADCSSRSWKTTGRFVARADF